LRGISFFQAGISTVIGGPSADQGPRVRDSRPDLSGAEPIRIEGHGDLLSIRITLDHLNTWPPGQSAADLLHASF
jgi:hypothetical protein